MPICDLPTVSWTSGEVAQIDADCLFVLELLEFSCDFLDFLKLRTLNLIKIKMMATRNPKVTPKRKPSKPQARESTLSKDQGELN